MTPMRSPHGFLTRPLGGKRYDNIIKIGDIDFLTSVSEEDYTATNRFAEIIELPARYNGDIRKGSVLICHHNTHKVYNTMMGKRADSSSYIADNLFLVEEGQYFAYNNGSGWICINGYCFVKPIPVIKNTSITKLIEEEPLHGIMKFSNPWLRSKGINEGDKIIFAPDSEYEFKIDGEKLYRVYDSMIICKL